MTESPPSLDPRIKRTRQLLVRAFVGLLSEKSFEDISVQDITERATVNRATFYDHFVDKFALLETMVGDSFHEFLQARNVAAASACSESLKRLILAVCDFLTELGSHCPHAQRQFEPMAESKIKSLIRDLLLTGIKSHTPPDHTAPELAATVASWAIYGAALEWSRSDKSQSAEAFTETVLPLINASLQIHCPSPQ